MNIVPVHGIHDNGDKGIDRIATALASIAGYAVREPKLPRRWAISSYWGSHRTDAREVRRFAGDQSIVLAHSRGALVADAAMRQGAYFPLLFLFAPALPDDWRPPASRFQHAYVMFNKRDKALLSSRLLPFHPFTRWGGSLGRNGPRAAHSQVHPVECTTDETWLDHSNFWRSADDVVRWASWIHERIRLHQQGMP